MTDHEPSYYEIALTNRQVLIAFAILLVCLVAAFLAGVWIGRGDAAPPVEHIAEEPRADGASEEAEPLSFFGGDRGDLGEEPAEETAGPAGPGADTTLAEDLGESVAAGEVDRPVAPQTPPDAPRAGQPGREPAATPPAAAPRREPPARPQPAGEPAGGDVVVQVFSSRDRAQAESIVERLTGAGREAYLSPVEMSGQTMYRVRIGPFADRAQAQRVADEVRRQFKLDTWITPR